ncbi:MAG: chromate transporter [Bacteroidales bacterium]
MKQYRELFFSFAKIGALTIGGGYAMIPVIKAEVVDRKRWVEEEEFLDYLAISQSAPGILSINIAIFIGKKVHGIKGSIWAALGTALPSFFAILLIALFFENFKENRVVQNAFRAIRPVVVALIAVPALSLALQSNLKRFNLLIPIITLLLIVLLKISPIWIIVAAAFLALFQFYYHQRVS